MNLQHLSQDQLIDYIHRELTPADDAAILMHIEACEPCRAQYEEEARFSELLRVHARATERDLPAGVIHSIRAAITAPSQPSWALRLRTFLRPAIAVPLAAMVAIAIYFGAAANRGGDAASTIDAAYYLDDHAALASTVPFGEGNAVPTQLRSDQAGGASQVAAIPASSVEVSLVRTSDAAR